MTFLAITGQTWYITGLGFGIVLMLLFVFVYVMKLLGWIMQPRKEKTAQPVEVQPYSVPAPKTEEVHEDAEQSLENTDEAAIAYALHLYYNNKEALHDTVQTRLTIRQYPSQWRTFTM